jgi:molybdate transport system ATP-binding protein
MSVTEPTGIHARLRRDFGDFDLEVDLTLPGRGVTILFGASGCGKTTLLRSLAGLEPAARGYLSINGEIWQDDAPGRFLPPHHRAIGYVFQDAALFPHLSVRRNLDYGQRRVPKEDRRIAFDQAVDLLGIRPLLERMPDKLSGGERQRVGMARALLTSPKLLLMDEPLASLDLGLKREILPYLERLHDEMDIPVIYVTHSPDEMSRLGDFLVLMERGRVRGQGSLAAMLGDLDMLSAFAEEPGVVFEAVVAGHDAENGVTRLDFAGGQLFVPMRGKPVGRRVRCRIVPSDVSLTLTHAADSSILNILPATVAEMGPVAETGQVIVRLDAAGVPLLARITRLSCGRLKLKPGQPVFAQIKALAFLDSP